MGNFIWVNDRSRMNREVHVRICESLEVKFLLATRQRGWNREVPPTRLLSSQLSKRTKDTSPCPPIKDQKLGIK